MNFRLVILILGAIVSNGKFEFPYRRFSTFFSNGRNGTIGNGKTDDEKR